jgi:hypothetical protein
MRAIVVILLLMIIGFANISVLTGCRAMGHGTGEAVEEVEKGAEDFEEGYEEAD